MVQNDAFWVFQIGSTFTVMRTKNLNKTPMRHSH